MNRNVNNTDTQRQCVKCKIIKPLNSENYHKDKNRVYGFMYKCIECEKKRIDNRKDRWVKMPDEQRVRRFKYSSQPHIEAALRVSSYKNSDKGKSLETDVDVEFMLEMKRLPCTYCGHESTGLDRINNNLGHVKSNCLPCCRECNSARNFHFTTNEMKIIGEAIRLVKDERIRNGISPNFKVPKKVSEKLQKLQDAGKFIDGTTYVAI